MCVSFQEEQNARTRVAFRSKSGDGKSDDGTALSGRATIGEDFALTITGVQPADELVFNCVVNAGPDGVGEDSTMLKVFCESPPDPLYNISSTFSKTTFPTGSGVRNLWPVLFTFTVVKGL